MAIRLTLGKLLNVIKCSRKPPATTVNTESMPRGGVPTFREQACFREGWGLHGFVPSSWNCINMISNFYKSSLGCEMAQGIEASTGKPDDLSSILRAPHGGRRELTCET